MVCPSMASLLKHPGSSQQQHEDRKFKCNECGRSYRHAGSLANHKKTHEVGSFQCTVCGKVNWNASALKSHLRTHTSQKKFFCMECGKSFRLATQLATHERVHLAQRTKHTSCNSLKMENSTNNCEKDRQLLLQQLQPNPSVNSVHGSSENKSYEDKSEKILHSQLETSDEAVNRPFSCNLCEKSYIHHRSLVNHKMTHKVGIFECCLCYKTFNNKGALYSHQRSHKIKNGTEPSLRSDSFTNMTQEQFSPQSQDTSDYFCHLCQVTFQNDEEFQEHILMHDSSASFELENAQSEKLSSSYDNSISFSDASFCASPVDHTPLYEAAAHHIEKQQEIITNDHVLSDCSSDVQLATSSALSESPMMDGCVEIPTDSDNAAKIEAAPAEDSDKRPFKCQLCDKSYRHSGSLINHKRSHQVGIYKCSVCGKNYPHLAALKSHLRLHKSQSSTLSCAEEDWASSQLIIDHLSQSKEDLSIHPEDKANFDSGAFYQNLSEDTTTHLHHSEHIVPRHMCADCGETFSDLAGIKCHNCPFLQQQHDSSLDLQHSDGHCAAEDDEFHCFNGSYEQFCSEQSFHDSLSRADDDPDEDNDGDHYQCSVCGNSYSSLSTLRSHLRGHTQSSSAPMSPESSSHSSHLERDNELGEMMICSTCGESFISRQDLSNHQHLHKMDQMDNKNDSQMSFNVQDNKEEVKIACGVCGIFGCSSDHLMSHDSTASIIDEPVSCKEEVQVKDEGQREGICRERFEGGERRYKCDHCGHSYRHAGSLINHKKSHKTGVFRCTICQKRYYNLLAFKNHQRSHFDIKRHACHMCGKAFKIQKQLLNHLRRHKENQTKIQEINSQIQELIQQNESKSDGKSLPSLSDAPQTALSQHCVQLAKRRAGLAKPGTSTDSQDSREQRPFVCNQCGRTYRHAGSLVNHRNSHKTGEYCCAICKQTYSNQLAMKNHLRTHMAFKKFLCQTCGKGFRRRKQLQAHTCADLKKKRSPKSRELKCRKCKKTFVSVAQRAAHICDGPPDCKVTKSNTTLEKVERPFRCNICSRTYRHAGSLLNHKNTHKTGHFSCTFCAKPFTNPMALRNHTRIHTQKKKYVCLTCGKSFRLASILHNHQKVHSQAPSPFSCPSCGKNFQGSFGLKRHSCSGGQDGVRRAAIQPSHRADKCFTCDLCGRSYRHAGSLLNHKKSHSEALHHCTLCLQTFPDPVTLQIHSQMRRQCCPECGKSFCLEAHLKSHMKAHSKSSQDGLHKAQQVLGEPVGNPNCWDAEPGDVLASHLAHLPDRTTNPQSEESVPEEKSHVCEHCGRTYRHAGSLLNHKNSHKTGYFSCSVCQKEFTNLMALKNHRRIHTEPKRYQCLECGKAFRVSTQLICHRRIHTKEKPFTCSMCDKSFSSKSNLRHHQKTHQNAVQAFESSFSMDANTLMDLDIESFL